MSFFRQLPSSHRVVFFVSFAVAMLFAAYTNHVWEDYYITYRASKNLATGHGLVFNHGDRLHTFTSPLGVLLPAAASLLTFNQSDTVALWIFRVLSAAAFAGACTLFYAFVRHFQRSGVLAALAVGWVILDAKSLDFTINGMETGLLLLFVAWTVWAQFAPCPRRWLWLGLGWAGLMWTRPDGFLYIGLLAIAGWLFNDQKSSGLDRRGWLKVFLFAGLVCTAVYLPWFAGSWLYYGTPIPHTIVAKSTIVGGGKTLVGALETAFKVPYKIWGADNSLRDAFLPAYHMMGGWPGFLRPIAEVLGLLAAFGWILPFIDRQTRALSFTFFGLHAYLNYYPYFPFPWYLPGTTLLGLYVVSGLLGRIIRIRRDAAVDVSRSPWVFSTACVASLYLILCGWTAIAVARQFRAQQKWIETGNRRKIGEWLRTASAPGDRVFLEPLGYIGFFSGMKTYDFPGMSSREMVEAVRRLGGDWAPIIDYLSPEWLVLRPKEVERVTRSYPSLLTTTYHQVREFNVLDEVQKLSVHGRPYLEFDACFRVFRRDRPNRFVSDLGEIHDRFAVSVVTIGERQMQLVHAPGSWIVKVPAGAKHVHVAFGFPAAASEGDIKTDGATFAIKLVDGAKETVLMARQLDPTNRPADRGAQLFEASLPPTSGSARLELVSTTGPTDTKDWTSWSRPEFW